MKPRRHRTASRSTISTVAERRRALSHARPPMRLRMPGALSIRQSETGSKGRATGPSTWSAASSADNRPMRQSRAFRRRPARPIDRPISGPMRPATGASYRLSLSAFSGVRPSLTPCAQRRPREKIWRRPKVSGLSGRAFALRRTGKFYSSAVHPASRPIRIFNSGTTRIANCGTLPKRRAAQDATARRQRLAR